MIKYTKTIGYNSQLSTIEPNDYGSYYISKWVLLAYGEMVSSRSQLIQDQRLFYQTHAGNMISEYTGWQAFSKRIH